MQKKSAPLYYFVFWILWLMCKDVTYASKVKKSLSLTLTSHKNQTGHSIIKFLLNKSSKNEVNNWKVNIQHTVTEENGIHTLHIDGNFAAPPEKPSDYELFPGVGYYKFHTTLSNGFEDASSICAKEGGHLAIVNSEAEHQVLQTIFARYPENKLNSIWAFVGFHDRFKEGEHLTIFGEPLNSTGFTRWSSSAQPDNAGGNENCGSVHRSGGLNDIRCTNKLPFFCEYDLSWN